MTARSQTAVYNLTERFKYIGKNSIVKVPTIAFPNTAQWYSDQANKGKYGNNFGETEHQHDPSASGNQYPKQLCLFLEILSKCYCIVCLLTVQNGKVTKT